MIFLRVELSHKYKKSWLINTYIARDLTGFSVGERLPTIQEFTQKHAASRGIVQQALEELQNKGASLLEGGQESDYYLD